MLRDVWRLWLPPSADGTVRWEPLAVRVADRADAVQGDDQPAERYGHTAVAFGDRAFVYGGVRESARAREGDQSSRFGVSSDVWEVNAATGEMSSSLPRRLSDGWEVRTDPSTGRVVYANPLTAELRYLSHEIFVVA